MSIADYAEEKTFLASMLKDAWTDTLIAWPGIPFKTPDSDSVSWLEFNIVSGEPSQISVGAPGKNIFRHPGIVSINVLTPAKLGEEESLRLADLVAEIFRAKSTDASIRFNPPTINRLGVMQNYTQRNVSIPFNRDSLF